VPTWHIDCHMVPNSPRGNNYKTGGAIIRRGRPGAAVPGSVGPATAGPTDPGNQEGLRRWDKNRDMNVPPLRIW